MVGDHLSYTKRAGQLFFSECGLGQLCVQRRKRRKDTAALCAEVDILCAARSSHIVALLDVHRQGLVFELGEALPLTVSPAQLKVILEHCCRGRFFSTR